MATAELGSRSSPLGSRSLSLYLCPLGLHDKIPLPRLEQLTLIYCSRFWRPEVPRSRRHRFESGEDNASCLADGRLPTVRQGLSGLTLFFKDTGPSWPRPALITSQALPPARIHWGPGRPHMDLGGQAWHPQHLLSLSFCHLQEPACRSPGDPPHLHTVISTVTTISTSCNC